MNGYRPGKSDRPELVEAIGRSEAFLKFQEQLSAVAPVERPVLLLGERGTGKELAALRLHYLSKRWDGPLVTLNCAALAESLIEAELFGHEAGAFTGATGRRMGRFEAASGGALFLDEAACIPMTVQEKILRAVEYRTFERLGSSTPVFADARILAAANADLAELARQGKFKPDLLDRLSFEVLFAPPLRERHGDVLLLAGHFAARMAAELDLPETPEFASGALRALEAYPWPGNVRELKNVVERAVYRSRGERIREIVFNPFVNPFPPLEAKMGVTRPSASPALAPSLPESSSDDAPVTFQAAVDRLKKELLGKALQRARHNQRKAAELLGLTYNQFRGLYRKFEPDAPDAAEPAQGRTP